MIDVFPSSTPQSGNLLAVLPESEGLTTELPFAGHPTLGTTGAWLDAGGAPRTPDRVVQECGIGLVPMRIDEDTLAFAAPPLIRSSPVDASARAP